MKINIITDPNSWFNSYIDTFLIPSLSSHDVSVVTDVKNIQKGDILFALSLYQIIKPEYLNLNKSNVVIHESDLPAGKGWSPFAYQVLEGRNDIIFSLFEIDKKMDNGPIYFKDTLKLEGHELCEELRDLQAKKRIEICLKYVEQFPMKALPQSGVESFYKKRTGADSELDINKTIIDQFNLLRIVDNQFYPAFFNYKGNKYKIAIEKIK